ncbi:MAG: hypothetical protein Q7T57_04130, partial [Dehalococcoidales bacterium]|nr:hypothetical protein [Dehalococcoidales bacterium]
KRIQHRFTQQHTIRHVLEYCAAVCHVLESNRVSDVLSEFDVELLRDTLRHGHRSDTTRLLWMGDGAQSDTASERAQVSMEINRHCASHRAYRKLSESGVVAVHRVFLT